jgi:hypothetical protein
MVNSRTRVPENTSAEINRRIRERTAASLRYYGKHRSRIAARLRQLDREWDIERAIEANAATIGLLGVLLGTTRDRRWLTLPALVTSFLLQHAVQGWCPPVPILRRLGFRTAQEIDLERQALKALRGDYASASANAEAALQAARS